VSGVAQGTPMNWCSCWSAGDNARMQLREVGVVEAELIRGS